MASKGVSGIGVTLKRNGVLIAEVVKIGNMNKKRKTIDVTSLGSTGGYMEFIGGLRDGGQIPLELIFRRDSYKVLNTDFEQNSLHSWVITLNDSAMASDGKSTTFTFNGFVLDLGMNIPLDDKVSSSCTLQVSGIVTISSI